MKRRGSSLVVLVMAGLGLAAPALAQTTGADPPKPPPATTTQTKPPAQATPPPLPVDVDAIRQALNRPRPIHLDDQRLKFYLEVHPPEVSFMALVGSFDLMKGPVAGATITSRDIDRMVTPREMYGSAGITATDLLQFAATNYAAQTLIRRAAEEIRQAKNQKEIDDIRARIDRELAALMKDKDK